MIADSVLIENIAKQQYDVWVLRFQRFDKIALVRAVLCSV